MKFKSGLITLLVCVSSVLFLGCEGDWTAGGGVESWNARYNWVNFSGVYRKSGTGFLVSNYSSESKETITEVIGDTTEGTGGTPGESASRTETFAIVTNQASANWTLRFPPVKPGSVQVSAPDRTFSDDGEGNLVGNPRGSGSISYESGVLSLVFTIPAPPAGDVVVSYIQQSPAVPGVSSFSSSGRLSKTPITPGSVTISVGSTFVLRDNGAGGLSGSGITGTIDYDTGAWSIDYAAATVPANAVISAIYETFDTSGDGRGSTGVAIHTFTVHQEGNILRITDNFGRLYNGVFGSVRATGGADQDNQATPEVGDTVIGQFEVSGTSAAGRAVTMVGTFQGVVAGGLVLSQRTMSGTWIEDGGKKNGDILGTASPLRIDTSQIPTTTTGTTGTGTTGTGTTTGGTTTTP